MLDRPIRRPIRADQIVASSAVSRSILPEFSQLGLGLFARLSILIVVFFEGHPVGLVKTVPGPARTETGET